MLIGRWVKLLTHDWSSGCLATASTFSVTMVSRFKIVENENTKNSTEHWRNGFEKWANESNFQANLEEYESDVLDQTLSQFFAFRNSVILPPMLLTSNRPMRFTYRSGRSNRPFSNLLLPLFKSESEWEVFVMTISFVWYVMVIELRGVQFGP